MQVFDVLEGDINGDIAELQAGGHQYSFCS